MDTFLSGLRDAIARAAGGRWWLRLTTIIWFVLGLACLAALPVLFDASALVVIAVVVLAVVLGAGITGCIYLVRKRGFAVTWLKSSLASFFVLSALLASPFYYFATITATKPSLIPRVTMTDGNKTVILQGMMHIGSVQFYKSVVYDAEKALSEGYVLYYEGVQPNPEADKWFSKTLAGGGDLSANYRTLGKLCGLQFQLDYFKLLEKDFAEHPQSHVAADVDTLDMKQEYDRLMKVDPAFAAAMKNQKSARDQQLGMIADGVEWLKHGTEGQRRLAGVVCRGVMTGVGNKSASERPLQPIEKVLLVFRNRALVDRIVADPHDKIYITYGARHIAGIVELLQQRDPAWRAKSVTWMRSIETPRTFEGRL